MLHQIDYNYLIPEWASMNIDMDETLEYSEKEAIALAEIKTQYNDIENIEIENIKVID